MCIRDSVIVIVGILVVVSVVVAVAVVVIKKNKAQQANDGSLVVLSKLSTSST